MLKQGSLWLPRLSWFQDSKENKTRIETQTFFQPVEQTYTPKSDISSEPSINFQKIRHVFQGGYLKKKKQLTSGEFQKNIKKKHMLEKKNKKTAGVSTTHGSFQVSKYILVSALISGLKLS